MTQMQLVMFNLNSSDQHDNVFVMKKANRLILLYVHVIVILHTKTGNHYVRYAKIA